MVELHMNWSGWLFMALAWGAILGLNIFCFYQVFRVRK